MDHDDSCQCSAQAVTHQPSRRSQSHPSQEIGQFYVNSIVSLTKHLCSAASAPSTQVLHCYNALLLLLCDLCLPRFPPLQSPPAILISLTSGAEISKRRQIAESHTCRYLTTEISRQRHATGMSILDQWINARVLGSFGTSS
jgi:hypothetical protein